MRITLILIFLLTIATSAEIRFINGTGKDLQFDLLSESGQVQNISAPTSAAVSDLVGPKTPHGKQEMMILKDSSGTELYRQKVQSGSIYIIKNWSPYNYQYVGKVAGGKSGNGISLLNGSGQKIRVTITKPDFTQWKGFVDGPDTYTQVKLKKLGPSMKNGQAAKVKISTDAGQELFEGNLKVGTIYQLDSRGKVSPITTF